MNINHVRHFPERRWNANRELLGASAKRRAIGVSGEVFTALADELRAEKLEWEHARPTNIVDEAREHVGADGPGCTGGN